MDAFGDEKREQTENRNLASAIKATRVPLAILSPALGILQRPLQPSEAAGRAHLPTARPPPHPGRQGACRCGPLCLACGTGVLQLKSGPSLSWDSPMETPQQGTKTEGTLPGNPRGEERASFASGLGI